MTLYPSLRFVNCNLNNPHYYFFFFPITTTFEWLGYSRFKSQKVIRAGETWKKISNAFLFRESSSFYPTVLVLHYDASWCDLRETSFYQFFSWESEWTNIPEGHKLPLRNKDPCVAWFNQFAFLMQNWAILKELKEMLE